MGESQRPIARLKKLAQRTYLALRFGAPAPDEYFEWELVMATGWTLEYVRSLSMQDFYNYLQIEDAKGKARR